MQTNLWVIIQCSMSQFGAEVQGLHPDIIRNGYRTFFQNQAEMMRGTPVHGVIIHTPRGLDFTRGNGAQAFCLTTRLKANENTRHLDIDEISDGVQVLRKHARRVALYEGPPPAWYTTLGDSTRQRLISDELGAAADVADYVFVDGAADKAANSPTGRLLADIDQRGNYRDAEYPGGGVEHMATPEAAAENGRRISFTLAGRAKSVDSLTMETGAFDPEALHFTARHAHPKFATYEQITGERVVMDLYGDDIPRQVARMRLMTARGFSPCVPLWSLRGTPYRHGFHVDPSVAVQRPAPAPVPN